MVKILADPAFRDQPEQRRMEVRKVAESIFDYVSEAVEGDEATVKTAIATKKGSDIPVDYRLHRRDGRWLVYDVIIEGVSLVSNYRTQFNKIVQTESYDALVQRLRAKDTAEPAASPGRSRTDR